LYQASSLAAVPPSTLVDGASTRFFTPHRLEQQRIPPRQTGAAMSRAQH
jgi:hypothetical protein